VTSHPSAPAIVPAHLMPQWQANPIAVDMTTASLTLKLCLLLQTPNQPMSQSGSHAVSGEHRVNYPDRGAMSGWPMHPDQDHHLQTVQQGSVLSISNPHHWYAVMGADSLLSSHSKLNVWNIPCSDLLAPQVGASNQGSSDPFAFLSAPGAISGQTSVHAVEEPWLPLGNLSADAPGASELQCALTGGKPLQAMALSTRRAAAGT
jgi:hypothetical protein